MFNFLKKLANKNMSEEVTQPSAEKKVSALKGRKRSPEFVAKLKARIAEKKARGETWGRKKKLVTPAEAKEAFA